MYRLNDIGKKLGKDFWRLSSSESVDAATRVMEKMNVDYLLIEEEGEVKGIVTPRELVGYPSSRLILDCIIQPIDTISEQASVDKALKALEEKTVSFLLVLSKGGKPIRVINKEIIIDYLFQELKKLNEERDKYITELKLAYQELKDTQAQLLQSGKLAAMGEMAAGIAHELTQPLLGIKGFVTAMLEDMKCQTEISQGGMRNKSPKSQIQQRTVSDLETILQQTDRMTAIVSNVRDFARASGTEMALLDINQPVEDALMLFSEQLRLHNIVVEKNLPQCLPPVMGNFNQLQQVLINLIVNARDAIDARGNAGRLMVSTRMSSTDSSVLIEFEDNGIGVDAETASRMFEPFFTTKPATKGAGLGLSIVARIIEQHGGTIDVQSEPGRGCKFIIRLPVNAWQESGKNG
ncbi:MAG: ATP-binding protein [Dehalococcoidia bacterium]|nr:ATP-binding protein [Dehalococcoidia bacterium]